MSSSFLPKWDLMFLQVHRRLRICETFRGCHIPQYQSVPPCTDLREKPDSDGQACRVAGISVQNSEDGFALSRNVSFDSILFVWGVWF